MSRSQERTEGVLTSELEQRAHNLVRSSPMGMHFYCLKADERLIFEGANPAADRLLGVTHDQFVGKTIEEAFPSLIGTDIPAHYRRVAAGGEFWQTQQIDYEDDQIRGAFEVYAFRISSKRMVAAFLDVTERIRNEEERSRLLEQLRHAQKMDAIGRLAGGVAHDFNNLLTAIQGYADLIRLSMAPGDPEMDHLHEILDACSRASALTQQLLAFSRKQPIEPKIISLNLVIRRAEGMLARVLGERILVELNLAQSLCTVRADPNQIDQILLNLAVNARDAIEDRGRLVFETANVELDEDACRANPSARPGPFAMISVSDTGQGMDEETCKRAFEPFFSTKSQGEGTGLGLATVYGIVQQNRGVIVMYSKLEVGTTVKIYLPEETGSPDVLPRAAPRDMPTGHETILLVEDEKAVRELAIKMLERLGYTLLHAEDGPAAREIAEGHAERIDLLLTDVIMPEMNGKELYQCLSASRPDLRVLYTSGYAENVIANHGVIQAGTVFLAKPFSLRSLAQKIREALDD